MGELWWDTWPHSRPRDPHHKHWQHVSAYIPLYWWLHQVTDPQHKTIRNFRKNIFFKINHLIDFKINKTEVNYLCFLFGPLPNVPRTSNMPPRALRTAKLKYLQLNKDSLINLLLKPGPSTGTGQIRCDKNSKNWWSFAENKNVGVFFFQWGVSDWMQHDRVALQQVGYVWFWPWKLDFVSTFVGKAHPMTLGWQK